MELLVSVRSPTEAQDALQGGAGLIDVKEPRNGSLGRASEATVAAVVRQVAGRRPVSAALGELTEYQAGLSLKGLAFVKWGLAGCRNRGWRTELAEVGQCVQRDYPSLHTVAVAYVDWKQAESPAVKDVLDFAEKNNWPVVLLDTFVKDGPTLLNWLSNNEIYQIKSFCRSAGIKLALAGSLNLDQLISLRPIRPDWFAVRGAACLQGLREGHVDAAAVRRLVNSLQSPLSSVESLPAEPGYAV
ncbi:MAG TPA: (5-formylfuran-3-yl)methyl phosphate synthase [Gemmataceae bacterium]|nr:(5-formylfuran-3-yl)methyl phosphate synthase [Gemmataceae bacterium]